MSFKKLLCNIVRHDSIIYNKIRNRSVLVQKKKILLYNLTINLTILYKSPQVFWRMEKDCVLTSFITILHLGEKKNFWGISINLQ